MSTRILSGTYRRSESFLKRDENTHPDRLCQPLEDGLIREARRLGRETTEAGTWSLPNAPTKVASAPLYRRTATAISYGLMAGSAGARMVALPGEPVSAAGPLLSMVFMGLLALDANYTRQGGISQNNAAAAAHSKLKEAQAALAAMDQLPEQLRQRKQQELAEDMAVWLQDQPELQRQVLAACDTLVDIDTHARAAAANTSKVQIHHKDLASWRTAMGVRLNKLKQRRDQRHAEHRGALAHLKTASMRQRQAARLERKIGKLEDRIRMYDALGPEALQTVFVNLSATQAKQVRDVHLYGAAVAMAGPAQVISAVGTFGQLAGTLVMPAEVVLTGLGLGVITSGLSIISNQLDNHDDAPRELARATNAKRVTRLQITALADAQSRLARARPPSDDADGAQDIERKATQRALGALMRNRIRRYQEIHRMTNQAWIRLIKGGLGKVLNVLNGLSGVASMALVATLGVAGAATMGWVAIPLGIIGIGMIVFYLGSVANNILYQRKRKDAMQVDETLARLFMTGQSQRSLMKFMAGEESPLTIDASRIDALQLSPRVRKTALKRLDRIRQKPDLMRSNGYLGAMIMAEQWLQQLTMAEPDASSRWLAALPRQLGVPEVQILRIRAMIRAGQPMDRIRPLVQKALLSSVGLELKIHDTQHPDAASSPVAGSQASPPPRSAAELPSWEAIDDSPTRAGGRHPDPAPEPVTASPGRPTPDGSPHKPPQPHELQRWLGTLADIPGLNTTTPTTRRTIESQAWSLVWSTVREDSRAGRNRPGGRWRRSSELLAHWEKQPARRDEHRQRIRPQLKARIEEAIRQQSLPAIEVTDRFLNRVLEAASRQAETMGKALSDDPEMNAPALTSLRQHYSDVGKLAWRLMTPD